MCLFSMEPPSFLFIITILFTQQTFADYPQWPEPQASGDATGHGRQELYPCEYHDLVKEKELNNKVSMRCAITEASKVSMGGSVGEE